MTKFKVNDIVRIIKKPSVNQHIKLVGVVGYITGFSEDNKYIDFREITLNSFCGGMGAVDIDCIEHCTDVKYLNKFAEILESKRKEDEKQSFISAYEKLEDDFTGNKNLISELEKEINTIKNLHNLLDISRTYNEEVILKLITDKENKITLLKYENDRLTEEMNTPINKRVAWYLQCLKYG